MSKFVFKGKSLEEKLREQSGLLTKLAGYGLLPHATKTSVVNVPESSKYKSPNGNTCIGYWEVETRCKIDENLTYYCPSCGGKMSKRDSTLDGAHVYKPSSPQQWYFVPLCSTCNNPENNKQMTVDTLLVPVPPECYEEKWRHWDSLALVSRKVTKRQRNYELITQKILVKKQNLPNFSRPPKTPVSLGLRLFPQ